MGLGRAAAGSEVGATRPKPFPDGVWFAHDSTPPVRGFLHTPGVPSGDALVLTHGAGSAARNSILLPPELMLFGAETGPLDGSGAAEIHRTAFS
jgi:hypothetical protein